jgi:SMF family protein
MFSFETYKNKLTQVEQKFSPDTLFYQGNISLLQERRRVSVVGSRAVSDAGIKRTEKITRELVKNNIIVVSGLAKGVDTVAHQTAIKAGGDTIGVIGTPINQYYPKENKELQNFIAQNHLLISQFPEGYPTTPKNFPIRNRTMALISDATIIIEASEKSGTKHQGWEALRLGRRLFILENVFKSSVSWADEMLHYGAEKLTLENYKYLIESIEYLTTKEDEYAF